MYSRILVPLDGSSIAESALPYARLLCRAFSSPIELISVNETEITPRSVAQRLRSFNTPQHQVTSEDLSQVVATLTGAACKTTYTLAEGNAANRIVQAAESAPRTLIVICTRGRSGIKRWMLGSVTDKVVRTSTTPVLVVRGNARSEESIKVERVVLPLDGSPLAEQAIPHAAALASALKAKVTTVFVAPPNP
ncbi:MAG: universal stress protein [SAR202 cluster bacterium]|nr:universal stress protein [SAR202 cluster bacterium]